MRRRQAALEKIIEKKKMGTKNGGNVVIFPESRFQDVSVPKRRSAHLPDLADVCELPPRELVIGFPIGVFRARPII